MNVQGTYVDEVSKKLFVPKTLLHWYCGQHYQVLDSNLNPEVFYNNSKMEVLELGRATFSDA